MEVNVQFQIASLCFYLIIVGQYISGKRLQTMSNKIFRAMLITGGLNLLFDIATVYSLYYYDVVPKALNRFLHQCFIGSLDLFIALLCLFVISLVHNLRYHGRRHILMFVPFAISIIVVIFGDLKYHISDTGSYSYGMIAYTVYASVTLYLILTVTYLIRFRRVISRRTIYSLSFAILGEVVFYLIQMNFPRLLLSGLAMTLMITFVFYSLVNPSDFIEKETGIMNRYAFMTMLNELFGANKKFYVVTVSFDNWGTLNTTFGQEFTFQVMTSVARFLEESFHTNVYRSRTKCLSMLIQGDIDYIRQIARYVFIKYDSKITIDKIDLTLDPHILSIECPKFATSQEDVFKIIELFVRKDIRERENEQMLINYDGENAMILNRYITIEKMLKHAVEHDGFQVVYQPIYSAKKKKIQSCEALVRLKDTKTIGFVSPEEFILIAERIGVIGELGEIVFRKVCEFAKNYPLMELGIEYIEVNLSAIQYMNPNLAEELIAVMKEYSLPGSFFNFEITESAALGEDRIIQNNIKRLLSVGCSFSMDDYGTGYSNLTMMIDMPYHIIKLDKSLIWPCYPPDFLKGKEDTLADSKKSHVVLESSVSMVKNLDYQIVAEGIETREQLDALIAMGVDYIQGYYFSKPIQDELFVSNLKEWNA